MRVTDMRGVDLARVPFDFDLTFAALLLHPDGHVYHRYGGRDERGADTWLGLTSWETLLERTLEEHDAYAATPGGDSSASLRRERLVLEDLPSFAKRDKGGCIHCHSVFPALYEEARAAGTWSDEQRWVYPAPGRIGLDLDRDDQTLVTAVADGSVAARDGIQAGDRLRRAGGRVLATASDLSQVLHDHPATGGTLEFHIERGAIERDISLRLSPEWKTATALEFSWRPFKWGLTPAPGFGGPALPAAEKSALGLPPGAFAFRVTYIVTWGDNRRFGDQAQRAGLRKDDVFVSAAGKRDFASADHFHSWWRLTRRIGQSVEVEIRRDGAPMTIDLKIIP